MSRTTQPPKGRPHYKRAKDLDPEDEPLPPSDDSSNEEVGGAGDGGHFTGREHYENVGKSKLRKPEQPLLGAKYGGSKVSRDSLSADHGLDLNLEPLASVDHEDEHNYDDGADNDDEDPFAVPPRRVAGSESSVSGSSEDVDDDDDEEKGEEEEDQEREFAMSGNLEVDSHSDSFGESIEDEDEEEEDDDDDEPPRPSSDREKLKQLNKSDASTVAASLTKAAKVEVQKGIAIQKQQATYDRLLDSRIKLQKALTVSNELVLADLSGEEMMEAARKAEAAALALCSTIDSVRLKLDSTLRQNRPSTKRTREAENEVEVDLDLDRSTDLHLTPLWDKFALLESEVFAERGNVLKKWSATTRATSAADADIIGMLDSHIATEVARLDEAGRREQKRNALVYTDDSFYQSLLRDLIASRDKSSASADAISAIPIKLHPSGSSKKAVDTRASKGRKIRYTVHEKLQNFMAPDDHHITWTDAARQEFFASLFGQHLLDERGINNADEAEEGGEDHAPVDPQEAGLRLFRTN